MDDLTGSKKNRHIFRVKEPPTEVALMIKVHK